MRDPGPAADAVWGEVDAFSLASAFAETGFHADMLVLVKPDPERRAEDVPHDFNEAVITASGKPCLLLPATGPIPDSFDTIAIG